MILHVKTTMSYLPHAIEAAKVFPFLDAFSVHQSSTIGIEREAS